MLNIPSDREEERRQPGSSVGLSLGCSLQGHDLRFLDFGFWTKICEGLMCLFSNILLEIAQVNTKVQYYRAVVGLLRCPSKLHTFLKRQEEISGQNEIMGIYVYLSICHFLNIYI